ncbi:MAG: DNA-processing protein DprA [Spirochaetota bacterium]
MNTSLAYYFAFPAIYQWIWKSQTLSSFTSIESLLESCLRNISQEERQKIRKAVPTLQQVTEESGVKVVTYFEEAYPPLLRKIFDPPITLFVKGNKDLLNRNYMAVVGTRRPASISLQACSPILDFMQNSTDIGITSGLAIGIDKRIMNLAVESGLPVIGVMATGMDKEYPLQNRELYQKLKSYQNGLIVTEMRWGEPSNKWSFPKRNRIITGIANGVFILEAPLKSGAISSAHHALAQNRDIFVFTHPSQKNNRGGRKLISEGAKAIEWSMIANKEEIFHISKMPNFSYQNLPYILAELGKLEVQGLLTELGSGYYKKKITS